MSCGEKIEKLREQIVKQAVRLWVLESNVGNQHNHIDVISDIEIDWKLSSVSFLTLHSGTQSKKDLTFYELGLEGFNES